MKCKNCNESTNNPSFCSRSCAASFNNRNTDRWKGKAVKRETNVIQCGYCNKLTRTQNKKYCSADCRSKDQAKSILNGEAGSVALKKFRLELEPNCYSCGTGTEWNGQALGLELHHIDGDAHNNTMENTMLLCPNCHSQTSNFKALNVGKSTRRRY